MIAREDPKGCIIAFARKPNATPPTQLGTHLIPVCRRSDSIDLQRVEQIRLEAAQAGKIGVELVVEARDRGGYHITAIVQNTSDLPIWNVRPEVVPREGSRATKRELLFIWTPKVRAHEVYEESTTTSWEEEWALSVNFDDDSGVQWEKVGGRAPIKVGSAELNYQKSPFRPGKNLLRRWTSHSEPGAVTVD